jgi:hypothetical protein
MTQHTPGPWIGAGPSFGDPLPRYTTSIMTEWEHEDGGYIEICELPFHHHDDENEANARLIAAAPDLLEALSKIEAACAVIPEGLEGYLEPLSDALADARAAIAKATGEKNGN